MYAAVKTATRQISGPATEKNCFISIFFVQYKQYILRCTFYFEILGAAHHGKVKHAASFPRHLLRSERRAKACSVTKATVSERAR